MTNWLWMLSAGIGVVILCAGIWIGLKWRYAGERGSAILGAFFLIAGVVLVLDVAHVQVEHQNQVNCNTELIAVLKERSDARAVVDHSTHIAQISLPQVLADLENGVNDPKAFEASRDAFTQAAIDRDRLEATLDTPYPDCR